MTATSAARETESSCGRPRRKSAFLATAAAYERLDVTSFIMRNVLADRTRVSRPRRAICAQRAR